MGNPSVQHILNCGGVGSCHGGSVDGPYQWLKKISSTGSGISYETSQPYMACSSESKEGFCPNADWTCTPLNIAQTCGSFDSEGGSCSGLNAYPNATISDYGSISGVSAMQNEIYQRGPIAWGKDASQGQYWIVRNSWGEYWGEMGYVRVAFGALNVESQCSWAVVQSYTAAELNNQVHC